MSSRHPNRILKWALGGPTFKQNDVRFVRPKTLLNEVESLYEVRYFMIALIPNINMIILGKSGSPAIK